MRDFPYRKRDALGSVTESNNEPIILAQSFQGADDLESALASARSGVEELGVREDTSMHIELADDLPEEGKAEEAASRLIDALETRLELYVRLHGATIAE
jgi:hypothetical protein